ncbi:response regulator transcription factor [Saccharothrix australiensis]|uniref:Regulatory LuxR family protein n=1 Tax=Saccharothrix australiensis TaxID=2072 RepID=A0A495W239_9PSEU|nr:LuxR family transcriptional regulator [Saccharothrix australiensis]RKT54785.1 regulatory LuxR family protein [Saccharothrix australiensis]
MRNTPKRTTAPATSSRTTAPATATAPDASGGTGAPTALHGRAAEVALLRDVLGRGTGTVLVDGVPGVGKSRLLREGERIAAGLGYAVRRVGLGRACPEPVTDGRPALHVLDDAHLLDERAVAELLADDAVAGPHDGTAARGVWLVARRTATGPRPADVLPPALPGRTAIVALPPLTAAASVDLATDLLGAVPDAPLTRLVASAGGHPGLVVELVLGLREDDALRITAGRARLVREGLPARLTTLTASTLHTYSAECRNLLRVAAVLGDEVVYGELAPLLGTSSAGLIPALDEACAVGAVISDGERTAFRNELTRRLIAESVPLTLRRELRREVAAIRARSDRSPGQVPARPTADDDLDGRRRDVVRLVAQGLTNQQIARRLGLSPHTVNYHLRRLYQAYGVRSRIELLRAAQRRNTPEAP